MAVTADRTVAVVRNMRHAARRIDLAHFEQGGHDAIHSQLRPLVERLCDVALGFFEQTEGASDASDEEKGVAELGAACFAARLELAQAVNDLRNEPDTRDMWDMLDACNRARGSLVKATLAIERAACVLAGLPAPAGTRRDLDMSLTVRSTYAEFRASVTRTIEDASSSPGSRLLALRDAVRRMSCAPIYSELRVADRCALRRLDDRVEAAFARADEVDPDDLRRLLEEAASVAGMLMRINDREELRDHDSAALAELTQLAERSGALDDAERARVILLLAQLAGRDATLDGVIDVYAMVDRTPLVAALRGINERGTLAPGPPAPRS
jgi:hypothetical protein